MLIENNACPAKQIFIVAHSAGGASIHHLVVKNTQSMIEKVRAIALTDAVHGDFCLEINQEGKKWAEES